MRRSALLTLAALGAVVSLVGSTSLFSALNDTARTGTNSVESSALAASADIRLAPGTYNAGATDCGTFSDDLTSAFHEVSDFESGDNTMATLFCIKNVGSQSVTLSSLADELTDVDIACTGDEAVGDTSCGADGAGELSDVVRVGYTAYDTCTGGQGSGSQVILKSNATTPYSLGTIAPGATRCFHTTLHYSFTATVAQQQAAQSDRATWRFKFSAQA